MTFNDAANFRTAQATDYGSQYLSNQVFEETQKQAGKDQLTKTADASTKTDSQTGTKSDTTGSDKVDAKDAGLQSFEMGTGGDYTAKYDPKARLDKMSSFVQVTNPNDVRTEALYEGREDGMNRQVTSLKDGKLETVKQYDSEKRVDGLLSETIGADGKVTRTYLGKDGTLSKVEVPVAGGTAGGDANFRHEETPMRPNWEYLQKENSDLVPSDSRFYNFNDPRLENNANSLINSSLTRELTLENPSSIKQLSKRLLGPGASAEDLKGLTEKVLKLNQMSDADRVLPAGQHLKLPVRDDSAKPTAKDQPTVPVKPSDKPEPPKGDNTEKKFYTVQKGDNLWKIARRENPGASNQELLRRVNEIAKHNRLPNPNLIYPGQKLELPARKTDAPKPPAPARPEQPAPGKPRPEAPKPRPEKPTPGRPGPETPRPKPEQPTPGPETPRPAPEAPKPTPEAPRPAEPVKPGDPTSPKPEAPKPGQESPEAPRPAKPGDGRDKPPVEPEQPPKSEKERLERNAAKAYANDPRKLEEFRKNMEAFEQRAALQKLPPDEVEKTYKEVNRLLEAQGDKPLNPEQRARLAHQIVRHASEPQGIDQGYHNTCAINSLEVRMFSKRPSEAAKLISDVGTTGKYTTRDGITVQVDAKPHGESDRPESPPLRTHASEIFQVTAANINLEHQHRRDPSKQYRYEQRDPDPTKKSNGEFLIDAKTGQKASDDPNVLTSNIGTLAETYQSISGDKETDIVLGHSSKVWDQPGVKRISSEQELNKFLEEQKRAGKFPIMVTVECINEPFYSDSGAGKAGGSGGGHLVTITDYQPGPPAKVTIDNSWGPSADHDTRNSVAVRDLYHSLQYAPDAAKGVRDDVEKARAAGNPDNYKEFDVIRLERSNLPVTATPEQVREADQKQADALVKAMERAKADWEKKCDPAQKERALEKLNDLINNLKEPHLTRVKNERRRLGLA